MKMGVCTLEHLRLAWHQSTALRQARIMSKVGLDLNQDLTTKLNLPLQPGIWEQWIELCGVEAEATHGWAATVNDRHLRSLFDLNITTPFQLVDGTGHSLIDCTSPRNLYGAKLSHCRALTAITLALHAGKGAEQTAESEAFNSRSCSLPPHFRLLPEGNRTFSGPRNGDSQSRISRAVLNLMGRYQKPANDQKPHLAGVSAVTSDAAAPRKGRLTRHQYVKRTCGNRFERPADGEVSSDDDLEVRYTAAGRPTSGPDLERRLFKQSAIQVTRKKA